MATVITVLRSGGDFKPWHVQVMQAQVKRWAPEGTKFTCLSDVYIEGVECIQLEHDWPGWWAKMELFRPGLEWDLYTDLDNVIVGPIDDILACALRPVFNSGVSDTAWTALMRAPSKSDCHHIWRAFIDNPAGIMRGYAPPTPPPFGDAGFIVERCDVGFRWEKILPGQVVNISTMATPFGFRLPVPKPRIVLTHRPHRPWALPIFQSIYGEDV